MVFRICVRTTGVKGVPSCRPEEIQRAGGSQRYRNLQNICLRNITKRDQGGTWAESEEDIPNSRKLSIDRSVPLSISIRCSFHSQQSSMSSFRNHRVVIASLFLPTVAVIEESTPPTPEQPFGVSLESTISAVADKLAAANIAVDPIAKKPLKASIINHHRQLSASNPLKSIVEDLKDKVFVIFDNNYIPLHSSSSEPSCYTQSFTN